MIPTIHISALFFSAFVSSPAVCAGARAILTCAMVAAFHTVTRALRARGAIPAVVAFTRSFLAHTMISADDVEALTHRHVAVITSPTLFASTGSFLAEAVRTATLSSAQVNGAVGSFEAFVALTSTHLALTICPTVHTIAEIRFAFGTRIALGAFARSFLTNAVRSTVYTDTQVWLYVAAIPSVAV